MRTAAATVTAVMPTNLYSSKLLLTASITVSIVADSRPWPNKLVDCLYR